MNQSQNIKSYQGPTVANPYGAGYLSKTLSTQSVQAKALGSGASNPDLVSWYEQAYEYYNAVISGQEAQPDPSAWQSFMDQMQWAANQLGYSAPQQAWDPMASSGDPSTGSDPFGGSSDSPPSTNEFGGNMGTMGNYTYTDATASVGFTPGATNDIWSNDVTIPIPSLAAKVTSEITTDTRLSPPEQVLKVIVSDSATNTQAVYFVHDYQDATVSVQTPSQTQLTDSTGGLVQWSTYTDPTTAGDAAANAVTDRTPETNADGTETYVGNGPADVIDFDYSKRANGDAAGVYDVQSNSNFVFKNDDEVTITKEPDDSKGYDYALTVKHSDGTVDEYHLHKEYTCQLNGIPEHLSFINGDTTSNAKEDPNNANQMIVPDGFSDCFTVNGLTSVSQKDATAAADKNADYPKIVQDLAALMSGVSQSDLGKQLYDTFKNDLKKYDKDGDHKLSASEMKKAVDEGAFPPLRPTGDLISFLAKHDPKLKNYLGQVKDAKNYKDYIVAMNAACDRLAKLLGALYPGHKIKVAHSNPKYWWQANDMTFDGDRFEPICGGESSKVEGDVPTKKGFLDGLDSKSRDYLNKQVWKDDGDARGTTGSDPFDTGDY